MKHLQKLLLLLVLLVAGVQSAWAEQKLHHAVVHDVTIGKITYECCYIYNSYVQPLFGEQTYPDSREYYASIVAIAGNTLEDLEIPEYIFDGTQRYAVKYVGMRTSEQVDEDYNVLRHHTPVTINYEYVNKLTFKGVTIFEGDFTSNSCKSVEFQKSVTFKSKVSFPMATKFLFNGDTYINSDGTFRCSSANELRFNYIKHEGKIMSVALRNIYYQDNVPGYSGSFSDYFTNVQGSQVTAHVYDKTEESIANMHNSAVWCDFYDIIGHKTQYDVTLTSNGGGEVQLWKTNGSNSQLQYTMSEAGGEETVPLYDNADSYQIRLYYNPSIYEKPVIRRNGVEVATTNGNGYCFITEIIKINVNSYEVEYNKKAYRQLHLLNFGNGIVTLTGKEDGQDKTCTINGAADTYYGFDNTNPVRVDITPGEGDEVQKVRLWGYQPSSFTTDATTGVSTMYYSFDDDKSQQSLEIYYKKETIPDGTPFNVHMAVEGTLGVGAVFFDNDGDYDWSDSDIESNDFSYQMDPGGSENVIGIYHPADGPTMGFRVVNYLSAEEIAAGFTCTVKVYSNRGEVVSSGPSEWGGDYYLIPLDGTDTDVRVVFETNGRYIRGNNGDGGTVEIYCEGDDTPLSITESGSWFYPLLPKTGNPYAVITPQEGKTVTAILRDGSLLAPSAFLQSDGTYRVPLQGFDRGDSYYEIYIIYSEDMTVVEPTGITWSGIAMGEKLEDANMFEAMLNDEADYSILTTYQKTYSKFCQKFDDDVSSLKVNLIVKDGYDFKVYFNGEEFPHTFTKSTLIADQGLFLYTFETTDVATITPFLVDGTWSVEFKKPEATDIIEWNLLMVGDVDVANNENPKANALWMVNGEELLSVSEGESLNASGNIDTSSYLPTNTPSDFYINVKPGQTFKVSFNGTDVTNIFNRNANYDNDDGTLAYIYEARGYEQFATSGTWVVEVKNADLLTQHIQLTGEQLGSFIIQYLSGGGVLDDVQADNEDPYVTFSSDEKEYIKSLKIYVNVPQGYTFKAYFNAQEVTGFTLDNNYYVVTLDEAFITSGTWVVEFKKGITWTAVATGDVAEGMPNSGVEIELNNQDDLELVEVKLSPSNTHNTGTFNFGVSDGDITPTQMHAWIYCKPRYELSSVTFNGVEYIQRFNKNTSGVNPLYELNLDIDDDLSPFLVDGTWVVEFKKAGISWDGLIIGDVPQGATVELGLDGRTLEVFLNANEKSGSDIYPGDATGVDMEAAINAPAGYNFKVWFNGEEKTDKFDKNGYYSIPSNNSTEVAPYLQDGQWIILFYDDLERYDVNRDGTISIADVTTLVNKILGKD